MTDYQQFVNYLTAAQRGRTNTSHKTTPPRTKATPPRSPVSTSDAILKREIINIFNGR